jgi:hypothetical protein
MTRHLTNEGMLKILRLEVEELFGRICSNRLNKDLEAAKGENHVRDAT